MTENFLEPFRKSSSAVYCIPISAGSKFGFHIRTAAQGFHELLERDPVSKKNYFARPPKNHVNVPEKKVQTT